VKKVPRARGNLRATCAARAFRRRSGRFARAVPRAPARR
jgi:hypothetical protein